MEAQHVFLKITQLLKKESRPPATMFSLGFWLGRVLHPNDFEALDKYEARVGEDEANRSLCAAMEQSGRYEWDPVTDEVSLRAA